MNFPFFKFPSKRIFRLSFIFLSFFNSTVSTKLSYFLFPSKFWVKLFIRTRCCELITYLSFICKFLCYCSERGSSCKFKKAEFNCVFSEMAYCSLLMFNPLLMFKPFRRVISIKFLLVISLLYKTEWS